LVRRPKASLSDGYFVRRFALNAIGDCSLPCAARTLRVRAAHQVGFA
jgi:hypothetical protein